MQSGEAYPEVPPALPMDPTGIANLDLVLGGGIPRGTLVIVVGPPGSGKTTLANQMAFASARAGRRAMVLTALSEPTSKLIAHLRAFSFYEDDLVGDMVQFLNLQQFLQGGLGATGDELVAAARRARAGFVVLDGFRGVHDVDIDPQAARQFLYDVGTKLSVLGTTTIITSEADPRDPAFFPEATVADLIIGLHYWLSGVRQCRGLEAIKVRGGVPLAGLHGLALSDDGTQVYPRLEARVAATNHNANGNGDAQRTVDGSVVTAPERERLGALLSRATFDIPGLDALLGGGLTPGTSALVAGAIGTGKTLLALQFALAGARAGEPTLYVSLRETVHQLLIKCEPFAFGEELRTNLNAGGTLEVLRWSPVELNPDIFADELLAILDRLHIRRLVLDSAGELERAVAASATQSRVDDYFAALADALGMRGITTLFTKSVAPVAADMLDFSDDAISVMAENVLLVSRMAHGSRIQRQLAVIKMRFSGHADALAHPFVIAPPGGITLLDEPSSDTSGAPSSG